MNAVHTATPLSMEINHGGIPRDIIIVSDSTGAPVWKGYDQQFAEFLVASCNSYADMVKALQGFKAAWDENRLLTSDEAKSMIEALEKAGAA